MRENFSLNNEQLENSKFELAQNSIDKAFVRLRRENNNEVIEE